MLQLNDSQTLLVRSGQGFLVGRRPGQRFLGQKLCHLEGECSHRGKPIQRVWAMLERDCAGDNSTQRGQLASIVSEGLGIPLALCKNKGNPGKWVKNEAFSG